MVKIIPLEQWTYRYTIAVLMMFADLVPTVLWLRCDSALAMLYGAKMPLLIRGHLRLRTNSTANAIRFNYVTWGAPGSIGRRHSHYRSGDCFGHERSLLRGRFCKLVLQAISSSDRYKTLCPKLLRGCRKHFLQLTVFSCATVSYATTGAGDSASAR